MTNTKFGDIVILKEANLSSLTWHFRRIIEIFPGSDNITQVIKYKRLMEI